MVAMLSVMGEGNEGCIAIARRGCAHLIDDAAEFGAAKARFLAVDDRAHALPGFLDGAGIRTALARRPRQRGRQRMAARQRQPRRAFEHVGIDVGVSSTRGSGSVNVPVLSKTTVSASASRSIASPPLRMTPLRNREPAATTCTAGMASAIAHGQVMMSTAMAMTMESCSEAPATSQPIAVSAAVVCTTRRVKPRRAIGEPHGLRLRLRRLVQEPFDFLDQRAGAGGGDPHGQRAGDIDAAGVDRGAGAHGAMQRLAGHQALVDLRGAVDDGAVGRDAFARPHQHAVAGMQSGGRHLGEFAAGIEPVREFRLQAREIAGEQRGSCAASPDRGSGRTSRKNNSMIAGIEIGVRGVGRGLVHREARAPASRRSKSARPC